MFCCFAAALRLAFVARAVVGWAGTRLPLSLGGCFALGVCRCFSFARLALGFWELRLLPNNDWASDSPSVDAHHFAVALLGSRWFWFVGLCVGWFCGLVVCFWWWLLCWLVGLWFAGCLLLLALGSCLIHCKLM